MTLFGKVFTRKEKTVISAEILNKRNKEIMDIAEEIKCNFSVAQQHEWLEKVSRVITTVSLGENQFCVDHHLQLDKLMEAGNMVQTIGRIAIDLLEVLEMTNMKYAVNNTNIRETMEVYCILNEYAARLKEPYRGLIRDQSKVLYDIIMQE